MPGLSAWNDTASAPWRFTRSRGPASVAGRLLPPGRLPGSPASCDDRCMGSNISEQGETQQVLDAVRRIVQALRESSRQAERRVGLTSAQLYVLQKLAESPA